MRWLIIWHFYLSVFHFGTLSIGQEKLFTLLSPDRTGITFSNPIIENEQINILTYEYFHNGGGVAIGDVNNDGLSDIYFTGNLASNRLYLNKGDWAFEDITDKAGVGGSRGWNTGVTMVDINHDGWMDIYVCLSGNVPREFRANQLYINNHDGTFTERAAEYGIDNTGYTTQAAFLDYDLDGDLDLYILNHNILPIHDFKPSEVRNNYDPDVGDKLYENENGKYVDVSVTSGLHTNPLGYGLGVSISDLNQDDYPDIYIANDFLEHDYCYLNNGDGTFTDVIKSAFPQISQFSMGTDIADFNNDGWMDIISVDMVAEDNYRQKTTMRPMDRTKFYYAVEDGFHYQYMHNNLQLNRGNMHFSNISKLAGVSNTDWSWAPLFVDLDQDGFKDLIVTNGYKKDISNKDYLALEKKKIKAFQAGKITNTELFRTLLEAAPVTKIENYIFKNNGDYTFDKMNQKWGFDLPAFSNGAAYGDLDNDGDLDIAINNIDQEAFIYENSSRQLTGNNYLKVKLKGPEHNLLGIGAKLRIITRRDTQYIEQYLTRGFQSSVDPILHIGVGKQQTIDELRVNWLDGKENVLEALTVNQMIEISHDNSVPSHVKASIPPPLFEDVTKKFSLEVIHQENTFDDFEFEVLLPHKMSQWGPALATGDINGDGLTDFFLGGSVGYPGQIYTQQPSGKFQLIPQPSFAKHIAAEDVGASFFDADQDGDLDLYVASGGNEYPAYSRLFQDRLYINNGIGSFILNESALPEMLESGSVVKPCDFDQDGDLDLFVGGRMVPRAYPSLANSQILMNDRGIFSDITSKVAPGLLNLGMVTDAIWSDYDADGDPDLILSGEWMPLTIFQNKKGTFVRIKSDVLDNAVGWGFSLAEGDFDKDGDSDYVLGNLGTNYKYKASYASPFQIHLNDFDKNGSLDIVLSYYEEGTLYPLRGKQCSSEQMPFISEKFPTYDLFAKADLGDIYGEASLDTALHYKATEFRSFYTENLGDGTFKIHILPVEAQFSAIFSLLVTDVNQDGWDDIITAGNLYASEVETPRNDAGVGIVLINDHNKGFRTMNPDESGLYLPYDVKHMSFVNTPNGNNFILTALNQAPMRLIRLQP